MRLTGNSVLCPRMGSAAGGGKGNRYPVMVRPCHGNTVAASVPAAVAQPGISWQDSIKANREQGLRMTDFAQRRTHMVDTQVRPNDVTSYPVIEAMLNVPREQFVPEARREVAYVGNNIDLIPGRVLLEPRTLGKMIDTLNLQSEDLVLNIGCGYGYAAAVMARIVEAVVAVEEDAGMAAAAESRLAAP